MDFALILAIAVLVTGSIWLLDIIWRLLRRIFVRYSTDSQGKRNWIIEYARAFFPVLLIVFLLRSFIIEPFRIPSGSMLPTLLVGDFILVNKFRYGIRLPVLNDKLIDMDSPDYGDVMVFRFPGNEKVNFIKRVVGLPGDTVIYKDKILQVNGKKVAHMEIGEFVVETSSNQKIQTRHITESFDEVESHSILIDDKRASRNLTFVVPDNTYFVLGDNRDYSNDSRFWGFVPEENIIGEAFLIWFSWDSKGGKGINWSRIANAIE